VNLSGLGRDEPVAGNKTVESLHDNTTPDAHRGDLDNLAGIEIEVAGLHIEGDELVELGFEITGVKDLKGLEHTQR
jgi:hypothetical protein